MYTKILVPPDGSQLAESVLPYVLCLAEAFRIPAELLQVIDSDTIHAFIRRNIVEDELKQSASNYLQTLVSSISSSMIARGRSAVEEGSWMLGSVAERVVKHCSAPVLVIPTPQKGD